MIGNKLQKKVKLNHGDGDEQTMQIDQRDEDKYYKIADVESDMKLKKMTKGWKKQVKAKIVEQRIYEGCEKDTCRTKLKKDKYKAEYTCRNCKEKEIKNWKNYFVLVLRIKDASGSIKAALFDDNSQKLFGCSAAVMKKKQFHEVLQIRKNAIRKGKIVMNLKVKKNLFKKKQLELVIDSLCI